MRSFFPIQTLFFSLLVDFGRVIGFGWLPMMHKNARIIGVLHDDQNIYCHYHWGSFLFRFSILSAVFASWFLYWMVNLVYMDWSLLPVMVLNILCSITLWNKPTNWGICFLFHSRSESVLLCFVWDLGPRDLLCKSRPFCVQSGTSKLQTRPVYG